MATEPDPAEALRPGDPGPNWWHQKKYPTPEDFGEKIRQYFLHCYEHKIPLRVTGLCKFLGMTRQAIHYTYAHSAGFSDVWVMARLWIEDDYVGRLFNRDFPTAGVIFALCNNFKEDGWRQTSQLLSAGDADELMEAFKRAVAAAPESRGTPAPEAA